MLLALTLAQAVERGTAPPRGGEFQPAGRLLRGPRVRAYASGYTAAVCNRLVASFLSAETTVLPFVLEACLHASSGAGCRRSSSVGARSSSVGARSTSTDWHRPAAGSPTAAHSGTRGPWALLSAGGGSHPAMRLAIWLLVELRPAATRNCQHARTPVRGAGRLTHDEYSRSADCPCNI